MEKTHVNIIPNHDEPKSTPPPPPPPPPPPTTNQSKPASERMTFSNDKENKTPEQSMIMNASTTTLVPTNDPLLDGSKKIYLIILNVFRL
jgi:hypothetical protein